jgi:hypothetical protein
MMTISSSLLFLLCTLCVSQESHVDTWPEAVQRGLFQLGSGRRFYPSVAFPGYSPSNISTLLVVALDFIDFCLVILVSDLLQSELLDYTSDLVLSSEPTSARACLLSGFPVINFSIYRQDSGIVSCKVMTEKGLLPGKCSTAYTHSFQLSERIRGTRTASNSFFDKNCPGVINIRAGMILLSSFWSVLRYISACLRRARAIQVDYLISYGRLLDVATTDLESWIELEEGRELTAIDPNRSWQEILI